MRRRLGVLLAGSLVATCLAVGYTSAPVASAQCGGQGNAHLSQKIGLPGAGTRTNVGFTLTTRCTIGGGTRTATGTIKSAACGRSTGGKGSVSGNSFKFQTVGTLGIVTGQVTGVFQAVSDVRKGDSCLNKSADDFLVTAYLTGI
jgi:hypothetical protein